MNTMIRSDFFLMRSSLMQLAAVCLGIAVIMAAATGSVIGAVALIAVMIPYTCLFNLAAYDEQNNWERFRLTLPLSRRQVVFGRYASIILMTLISAVFAFVLCEVVTHVVRLLAGAGSVNAGTMWFNNFEIPAREVVVLGLMITTVITLIGGAIVLPLIARFGMTKAVRFVPFAIVVVLAAVVGIAGDSTEPNIVTWLSEFFAGDSIVPLFVFAAVALAIAAVLYILSAFVSAALYKNRAF